jgi:hypothetical protein
LSLSQDWEDELHKFAPGLRVGVYHGAHKDKLYHQLPDLDVVLSTVGTLVWGPQLKYVHFHRLIIDECHQPHRSGTRGQHASGSTTFGTSGASLWHATQLLCDRPRQVRAADRPLWREGLRLFDENPLADRAKLVPLHKKLMIRHAAQPACTTHLHAYLRWQSSLRWPQS